MNKYKDDILKYVLIVMIIINCIFLICSKFKNKEVNEVIKILDDNDNQNINNKYNFTQVTENKFSIIKEENFGVSNSLFLLESDLSISNKEKNSKNTDKINEDNNGKLILYYPYKSTIQI